MKSAETIAEWRLEDLHEGLSVSCEKTITREDVDTFAALSGDISPLHMDAAFAAGRGFKGRVAHGVLISSYVSRLLGVSLPGRDCLLHSLNMRYVLPVYVDDTIVVHVVLSQISSALRTLVLEVRVADAASDITVARGKAQVGLMDIVPQHE